MFAADKANPPSARVAAADVGSRLDYLSDRLGGILRLVPAARETHLRLYAFERMLDSSIPSCARFQPRVTIQIPGSPIM
jgi:hypothetical protein